MRSLIRSLMMHRFRSFMSVIGVMIGVASLVTMLSIGEGTKRETLAQINRLGIQNIFVKGESLSLLDQRKITENLPGLVQSASLVSLSGNRVKTSPSLQAILKLELMQGRFLCELDSVHKHQVCVLGAAVARSLGPKGTPGQSLRIRDQEMTIVGVLAEREYSQNGNALPIRNHDQTIYLPLHSEPATEMILQMKEPALVATAPPLIGRILQERKDLELIVPQELLNQARKSQRMFHLVLGLIAATSLLVGGIGIANVMMASVYERRSEIGIRRAVGATKRDILRQFLIESLLLTAGGTVVGLALGLLFSVLVSFVTEWTPVITVWSIVLSIGMAFIMGLSAGVYPAFQASNVDPMEALRV